MAACLCFRENSSCFGVVLSPLETRHPMAYCEGQRIREIWREETLQLAESR